MQTVAASHRAKLVACGRRAPLASAVRRQVRCVKPLCSASTQLLDGPDTRQAVHLSVSQGDVLATPDACVQVGVSQPSYAVQVLYSSRGRPLEGATAVWAHIGHSGWRDTQDVELTQVEVAAAVASAAPEGAAVAAATAPSEGTELGQGQEVATATSTDEAVWRGTYHVPVGRLSAPWHLETQLVFRGLVEGHERWDNNVGANWTVAVEVASGEGLVPALNPTFASTRSLTSSLLLRLEALVSARLLPPEQGALLRMLAWQHDLGTIKTYESVRHLDDRAVAGALAGRCSWMRPPGLNVVHVASEMAPIAKVGGLADVVASLAKAHQASGLLTEVILPKYDCINYGEVHELRQVSELDVPWGPEPGRRVRTVVWSGCVDGLPVYFIEPHCNERYFWRGKFYGDSDDGARFCFFSRAALEFLARRQHEAPDLIHCHDWQAAAVAPLLKEAYSASGLSRTRSVLTIHNLAFQGLVSGSLLQHMGLLPRLAAVAQPGALLHSGPQPGPGGHGLQHVTLNLLKGAIAYCDRLTTVSPTYAREVLGPELGMGLHAALQRHQHKLTGVLNGLDYETWNPSTDPHLPAHFSADDPAAKRTCKAALCAELGLPFYGTLPQPPTATTDSTSSSAVTAAGNAHGSANGHTNGTGNHNHHANGNGTNGTTQHSSSPSTSPSSSSSSSGAWGPSGRPLIALVTRLTEQKGLHLMTAGMRAAVAEGAQVVVLGSAPDPKVQREWEALSREATRGSDVRIVLRHDEALSHRIFAGADMLLVPSLFEPCGLTQLIALRYGTIPVVRQTGGLADTVADVAHSAGVPEHARNGFTFAAAEAGAAEEALRRAIRAYKEGREWWSGELVPRVMRQDWSWTQSAQRYQEIYDAALGA